MTEYEWTKELDERQRKELELARIYAKDFGHGTDGHHRLLLIAKLATMLDDTEDYLRMAGLNRNAHD